MRKNIDRYYRSADRTGTTLIELLVALVIAGTVISLGFSVYATITRDFHRQSLSAEALRNKILVKKRIDGAFSDLASVEHCSGREVRGKGEAGDGSIAIRYVNNSLLNGTDTLVTGLKECTFELSDQKGANAGNNGVLCWELLLDKGGWVGGAVVVTVR